MIPPDTSLGQTHSIAAMEAFYPLGVDGSGHSAIPDSSYDFILLHHVVEHMPVPAPILTVICINSSREDISGLYFLPYAACLYPPRKEHFNSATIPRMSTFPIFGVSQTFF
jgi:hypothetical protein